jgi:hypothetical protein
MTMKLYNHDTKETLVFKSKKDFFDWFNSNDEVFTIEEVEE